MPFSSKPPWNGIGSLCNPEVLPRTTLLGILLLVADVGIRILVDITVSETVLGDRLAQQVRGVRDRGLVLHTSFHPFRIRTVSYSTRVSTNSGYDIYSNR
jgi:hypothetical protein